MLRGCELVDILEKIEGFAFQSGVYLGVGKTFKRELNSREEHRS